MEEGTMSQPSEATRMIIPAPAETRRDTGIVWYEARVERQERTVHIVAFAARDRKLAELRSRVDPETKVTAVVSDAENHVIVEVQGYRTASGVLQIRGRINDHDFAIPGQLGEPASGQPTRVELNAGEREVLRPWRGLANSLEALAQATREPVTAMAARGWGCDGCLLVGAAVATAAEGCVGGDANQCGVLLDAWDTFRDNCDPPPCH
jgi:hypothetical protein